MSAHREADAMSEADDSGAGIGTAFGVRYRR